MDSEVIKEKIETDPVFNDPRYITLLSFVILIFTVCKCFYEYFNKLSSPDLLHYGLLVYLACKHLHL